jgi:hypothetical protein
MRPYDVNHRVSAKLRKIVHADDRVVMATPHIIYPRFERDEIVDVRSAFSRPVHLADNPAERKSAVGVAAGQLLERLQHPILIETAVTKICFRIGLNLELPTLLGGCRVDPYLNQPLLMVMMLIRINDVNRLVTTLEPVLNERKQHAILFVVAVEERTDMTYFVKLGTGKMNGRRGRLHMVVFPPCRSPAMRVSMTPVCTTLSANVHHTLVSVRCRWERPCTPRRRSCVPVPMFDYGPMPKYRPIPSSN